MVTFGEHAEFAIDMFSVGTHIDLHREGIVTAKVDGQMVLAERSPLMRAGVVHREADFTDGHVPGEIRSLAHGGELNDWGEEDVRSQDLRLFKYPLRLTERPDRLIVF